MCKLILRDEARHIDFHRDRLAARFPQGIGARRAFEMRALGWACTWFLWLGHGRALRAIGGSRAELFHHMRSGVANFLSELAQLTSGEAPSSSVSKIPAATATRPFGSGVGSPV
jgi:hypothetical protein